MAKWFAGLGTLAGRYLTRRHLPIDLSDTRFRPRGRKPRTRFLPAPFVALRERRELIAVQRISLDTDTAEGTGKMLLGRPHASTWRGSSPASTLALAKGFEDAAAFTKLTGIACWAALGAERLPLLRLPDGVQSVILAPGNDRTGHVAACKAGAVHYKPGLSIQTRYPRPFKDWTAMNEQLAEHD